MDILYRDLMSGSEQQLNQVFGDLQNKQQGVPNDRTRECSRGILKLGNGNASVFIDGV
jgi:hypothetical protein